MTPYPPHIPTISRAEYMREHDVMLRNTMHTMIPFMEDYHGILGSGCIMKVMEEMLRTIRHPRHPLDTMM